MYIKNRRLGFTLAEVLITLGIIGVVASMTMPALNQKISDQKNMSSLKKTYSVLQQVTNLVASQDEELEYWFVEDNNQEAVDTLYGYYKQYFNVLRACPNTSGCWAYPTKYLDGRVYWRKHNPSWYQYSFTLSDGVNVLFDIYDTANMPNFGVDVDYPCLIIWVDVNSDKLPNQIGRDVFAFVVTRRALVPAGVDADIVGSNCNTKQLGWTCTAKIIREGWKINYLK